MNISNFYQNLAKTTEKPQYVRFPILIASSWLFQSFLYMNTAEKLFKMLLELLFLSIFLTILLMFNLNISLLSIFISFLGAHSTNWILNGHIPVLLKNLGVIETEKDVFIDNIAYLEKQGNKSYNIKAVVTIGSIVRDELKTKSDLDIRVISNKGLLNTLKTCYFVFLLRMKSFFKMFPLDIYVITDCKRLVDFKEEPVFIYPKR